MIEVLKLGLRVKLPDISEQELQLLGTKLSQPLVATREYVYADDKQMPA